MQYAVNVKKKKTGEALESTPCETYEAADALEASYDGKLDYGKYYVAIEGVAA